MDSVEITDGQEYTLPDATGFTAPTHKEFKGWLVNGTGDPQEKGTKITITADTTLTAVWADIKYTVSFNGAGAQGSMDSVEITDGQEYTLPECEFTYEHMEFSHWLVGTAPKAPGAVITITANTTITAVWEYVEYTISFNANGGTGSMSDITWTNENVYTLPANRFTAPAHKAFAGWSVNGGATVAAGTEITIEGATTITAVWEKVKYTISFNANGGSGTMAGTSSVVGEYTLPANSFTAPAGKQFKGWATSANGAIIEGTTLAIAGNVTLYAIWENIPTPPAAEPEVDYTDLDKAIADAEALTAGDYTDATWAELQAALAVAKIAKESDKQADVDAAVAKLKAAIDALEKIPAQQEPETDASEPSDEGEDRGCGSLIGGAAVALTAMIALAGISFKKKED